MQRHLALVSASLRTPAYIFLYIPAVNGVAAVTHLKCEPSLCVIHSKINTIHADTRDGGEVNNVVFNVSINNRYADGKY